MLPLAHSRSCPRLSWASARLILEIGLVYLKVINMTEYTQVHSSVYQRRLNLSQYLTCFCQCFFFFGEAKSKQMVVCLVLIKHRYWNSGYLEFFG